jgi:hypothetical protein
MRPNHTTNKQSTITRFALGQMFITPGAEEALQIAGQTAIEFLRRHMSGDWGELSDEDVKENEFSLKKGLRLLSAYQTEKGQNLWIITEADRSATTILLPSEY